MKRILRSIRQSEPPGKRDFAILLLLAAYGLGAAEVLALRLEDLDWQAGILRAHRPKTEMPIELPLLPPVAKALTAYLRWERPPVKAHHHLFVRMNMPYEPITSAAIRHRIRHYAGLAGISAKVIGAHAFRHAFAVHRLSRWYSQGTDLHARLPWLSAYMGHVDIVGTETYLNATPELLDLAGNRLRRQFLKPRKQEFPKT